MSSAPFTTAEFHNVVHKQIANAAYESIIGSKLDWELVAPFLDAARSVCRGEFEQSARIRFHTLRAEGEEWVEAEEAFLGIAVRGEGEELDWLSRTYWVSDIVLADEDPQAAERTIAALERSIARIRERLAEKDLTEKDLAEKEKGGRDGSD